MKTLIILFTFSAALLAQANTPGAHSVALSWTASPTSGVTYNLYRGTVAGVCSGTPTPYRTGLTVTSFTDTAGLTDGATIFYNVSAVNSTGGESVCDGELQVQIPVLPQAPTLLKSTSIH